MTKHKQSSAARRGVTLVEITIVLVIIGILLGGVLKGQELINNARVRAIADQQTAIKVAWFAFLDRFGGMPADYVYADQYIPNAKGGSGTGAIAGVGDGIITQGESVMALQQLAAAGYLRCQACAETNVPAAPSQTNTLQNAYGGVMAIFHSGYSDTTAAATPSLTPGDLFYAQNLGKASTHPRLMVHAGPLIPSNIVAEVDRKVDDSIANEGDIVFNNWKALGVPPPLANCMSTEREKQTNAANLYGAAAGDQLFYRHASVNPEPNCGMSNNL